MDFDIIIALVISVGAFLAMIALPVGRLINYRRQLKNYNPEDVPPQSDLLVQEAEVISKNVYTQYTGGYKFPSHRLAYRVAFKIENDKIKEYDVPFETYDKLKPHDIGNLITTNGNFFDFGQGEDM